MDTIFQAISLVSAIIIAGITLVVLFASNKERCLNPLTLLFSIAMALMMLPVFMFQSHARLNLWLALPLLAFGFVVGLVWGLTTRVYFKQGHVVGKPSLLALGVWGGAWVLSQVSNLFGSSLLTALGLVPLVFATGTQVGRDSNILLRLLVIKLASAFPRGALPPDLPESYTQVSSPQSLPERESANPATTGMRPSDLPK
ncbi:MAG: hypothetical protein HZB51_16060 [Chloroflexi bacterium]|nr:hypothetical protein [Chloroflexota bacterium]